MVTSLHGYSVAHRLKADAFRRLLSPFPVTRKKSHKALAESELNPGRHGNGPPKSASARINPERLDFSRGGSLGQRPPTP